MAIGLLEKRKIGFWDGLEKPVQELYRWGGMEDFLEEVVGTSIASPDTKWEAVPLYVLVDYLTHEHRNMFRQEVPDIAHLLEIHTLADSAEATDLRAIQNAFDIFIRNFETHVEEEESYLFPKILRYEACLRDRKVHPEFHQGSLQTYFATPRAREDRRFYQDSAAIAQRIRTLEAAYPTSVSARDLAEMMESLRDKLIDHYELESKILYSAAIELERILYNMTIDGHPNMASPYSP